MLSGVGELSRRQFQLFCFCVFSIAAVASMSQPVLGQSTKALLGSWSGQGKVTFKGATTQNIKCKAYNTSSDSELKLVIRCASASYRIEIRSKLKKQGSSLSGRWEERTYNATGEATGRIGDGSLTLAISGGGFTGQMNVSYDVSTMTVSISAQGIHMQSVRIRFARMTK
jgi:hypothetical protein